MKNRSSHLINDRGQTLSAAHDQVCTLSARLHYRNYKVILRDLQGIKTSLFIIDKKNY